MCYKLFKPLRLAFSLQQQQSYSEFNIMYQSEDSFNHSDPQVQRNNQCMNLLKNIDLRQQTHRQWIAKSFRKLNSVIQQNTQMNFNLSDQSEKTLQKAVRYAYEIRPFQFSQGVQTYSKQFCQSTAGKVKCEMPMIFKSGGSGWQPVKIQSGVGQIKENNTFNLKIQAEENSDIIVTYENIHPLRVKPQYREYYRNGKIIEITPPCVMCIVVTKQQQYFIDSPLHYEPKVKVALFKLPSNSIKLQIKKTSKTEGYSQFIKRLGDEHMIRPEQTFDHGISSSQGSNWHGYVNIQAESKSRD